MYKYEKPIAELIDFNLENIMDDPSGVGGNSGLLEDSEDRDN